MFVLLCLICEFLSSLFWISRLRSWQVQVSRGRISQWEPPISITYIYIYVYVCMYTYVYIYIHIHTYIHIICLDYGILYYVISYYVILYHIILHRPWSGQQSSSPHPSWAKPICIYIYIYIYVLAVLRLLVLQGSIPLRASQIKHVVKLLARRIPGTRWAKYPFNRRRQNGRRPRLTGQPCYTCTYTYTYIYIYTYAYTIL